MRGRIQATLVGTCGIIVLMLAMGSVATADTMTNFTPDRSSRTTRDTGDDVTSPTNNTPVTGDNAFTRPSRFSSLNLNTVNTQDGGSDLTNQAPTPPSQVPEPGTIVLVAPALLGLYRRFQR